ncbi:hypothetical protein EON66_05500 [archaeon]|nr:MAG: hypothetical protein EON66_05500 [archaeon]
MNAHALNEWASVNPSTPPQFFEVEVDCEELEEKAVQGHQSMEGSNDVVGAPLLEDMRRCALEVDALAARYLRAVPAAVATSTSTAQLRVARYQHLPRIRAHDPHAALPWEADLRASKDMHAYMEALSFWALGAEQVLVHVQLPPPALHAAPTLDEPTALSSLDEQLAFVLPTLHGKHSDAATRALKRIEGAASASHVANLASTWLQHLEPSLPQGSGCRVIVTMLSSCSARWLRSVVYEAAITCFSQPGAWRTP